MASVPTFCRHNRLTANCPICTREQNVAMRPLVSGGSASAPPPTREHKPERQSKGARPRAPRAVRERANAVKVRKLVRGADDGFASPLLPGLKSSEDAQRLVEELAFATTRLEAMAAVAAGSLQLDGPWPLIAGVTAANETEVDGGSGELDLEARARLAFETALSGDRGVSDAQTVASITESYDAWWGRAGSQQAALIGEQYWTPERRFDRVFERMAFKGFGRDPRFEMLVLLGRLGVFDLRAGSLHLTGENEATWAGKRAMGIADPVLLERRAREFAEACEAPLEALDLAFHNWGSGKRVGDGIDPDTPGDEFVLDAGTNALGL